MSRDYTKYNVVGIGENLNKRQLVFSIVKDWIKINSPSFEYLQQVFPDEVQGGKVFIRKIEEISDPKRFNMREPLVLSNGNLVVVSNQWGDNIIKFIEFAEELGYKILKAEMVKTTSLIDINEFDLYSLNKQFKSYLNDESTCTKLDEELQSLIDKDPKYISYAAIFEALSEYEYEYDREGVEEEFSLADDAEELKEMLQEQSLMNRILEIHQINQDEITSSNTEFKVLFTAYFCEAIKTLINSDNEEMVAEFIYAQSCSQLDIDSEDWIADLTIDILYYIFNKNIQDDEYSNECSIDGYYFGVAADSGYNYLQLSRDLIDALI